MKIVKLRRTVFGQFRTGADVARFWWKHIRAACWYRPEVEQFVVAHLDTRYRFCSFELISIGTKNCTLVHPREVFRGAIVSSAAAILLMHNHPSGNAQPSVEDIRKTQQLMEVGSLHEIEVIDHVVIGRKGDPDCCKGWASLRDLGYFSQGRE